MVGTAYEAWLCEQIKWIGELEQAYRKTCFRYIAIILIGTTGALFALGCAFGGITIGIQNALYGLLLGLCITIFCVIAFAAKSPGKCYLKSLKKEISREFRQEFELEIFAKQIQEATKRDQIRKISWEQSGGRGGKVDITAEYAVRFSENSVTIVKLAQVESMELDAYIDNISVRNEYGTIHRRQGNFIISFFYYHTGAEAASAVSRKKTADKRFSLPSREMCDKFAEYIRVLRQNTVTFQ